MIKKIKTINKVKFFAVIIAIILAGGAAYYLKSRPATDNSANSMPDRQADSILGISGLGFYKSDQHGFSFNYPKGYSVSDFDDGGGKAILVKNAVSDNGFQIFITAFDESKPVTKERILKDIPDMTISGDEYIAIGGEKSLSFISQDDLGGKMREIWLARSGYLYQIKAYENFEKQMVEILNTWKFY